MTSRTLPKPPESNKQVQEYMKAVRKGVRSQFVVQTREGWSVRPAIEPKRAVTFSSQEEAVTRAKEKAKAKHGEVFVFNESGSLISRETA